MNLIGKEGLKMGYIDKSVFIAEGARVIGDVTLEKNSSVWFNAVLRGDDDRIVVGEGSNIQDNCVIHTHKGLPTIVGKNVSVGHLALLHGCTVGDNSLIGMHATVMNGAVIGKNCVIGAGALVTGGTVIPDNSVAVGSPARVVRKVTKEDLDSSMENIEFYLKQSAAYLAASGHE